MREGNRMNPEEIRERDFVVALRGYDQDEVRAFLDEVASRLEEGTQSSGGRFDQLGRAAARVLEAAEVSGEEIVETASAEADRVRHEALEQAELRGAEARKYAARVRGEADELRAAAQQEFEQAAAERAQVAREREEQAAVYARATEAIRRAGGEASQILQSATGPGNELLAGLDEARRLLVERFEEARGAAATILSRSEEVVNELEVELPVDLAADDEPQDGTDEVDDAPASSLTSVAEAMPDEDEDEPSAASGEDGGAPVDEGGTRSAAG